MKILLFINEDKPLSAETAEKVKSELSALNIGITENINDCDIIITIGGDGTILRRGKIAAKLGKPLLGINTGTLGFMTCLERNELHMLSMLATGNYSVTERMTLEICCGNMRYNALNDIVFSRKHGARIPNFSLGFGNSKETAEEIMKIPADGVIVSTPTGSTGYSLSAGGAIVYPESGCIQFTPICPHTLFSRSAVFPANRILCVNYRENVNVTVDGEDIDPEENLFFITQSVHRLKLISKADGNSFYNAVHNKLVMPLK